VISRPPAGQVQVTLPDGLLIERLPVGLANGQEVRIRYLGNDVTAIEITYLHEGASFANEVIGLG
jgi:hypothetical protein